MSDTDDNLEKMNDQFEGLDMTALIGGPLKAACEAQMMLAQSTAEFIQSVGMEGNGKHRIKTTDFSFTRTGSPDEKGVSTIEKVLMDVPLLSIVKIPSLMIDDVDVAFDMEVKSSTSSETVKDEKVDTGVYHGVKIGPFNMGISIRGSVACHEKNTRQSETSAKHHVQVDAKDSSMPEGLARMLDILDTANNPVEIETSENSKIKSKHVDEKEQKAIEDN